MVVGGRPNERGVVSAASYAARKFGVHSAMPLRTAYKLCPQAIFVDGHPERYREYSHKVYEVLRRFSPLVEMASIDEAYLDMTGTERLLRSAAARRAPAARADQGGDAAELLDRHRDLAPGGEDQLPTRPSPTASCGSFPGRRRRFWRRSTCARSRASAKSRRRTCTRSAFARWATWRGSTRSFSNSASANGAWRWPASRAGWTPAAGSTREIGEDAGAEIDQPRAHVSGRHRRCGAIESTLARLCEMVGRRLREHGLHARTIQLKLRYSDFSTITRAHSIARADAARYRTVRRNARAVPRELEAGPTVRLLGVHASGSAPTMGRWICWRTTARAVEAGDVGGRPDARQVRRIGGVAGGRMQGAFRERTTRIRRGCRGNASHAVRADAKVNGGGLAPRDRPARGPAADQGSALQHCSGI